MLTQILPSEDAEQRPNAPTPISPLAELGRHVLTPIPIALTSFIGRASETTSVCDLLIRDNSRLVTLTGPGGVGKTRLSMHIANVCNQHFADGVAWVALSSTSTPAEVASAIAYSLGVPTSVRLSAIESVVHAIREAHLLLVLDNFEQALDAVTVITSILTTCREVSILVTSRTLLRINGEHVFAVSPLTLPSSDVALKELRLSASVQLFEQRAQAICPSFTVTTNTAQLVADICRRLDGLPLAIELAAARINHFSLSTLAMRLNHSLSLLVGGPRDAVSRQQTLRNAIAWSYDLLSNAEQQVFRSLAVFAGGFSLDAITTVMSNIPEHTSTQIEIVIDHIASLLDHSLIQRDTNSSDDAHGTTRYHMIETIRQFAFEQLEENGETDHACAAHASYFLALAGQHGLPPAPWILPLNQDWSHQIDVEHANLLTAMRWFAVNDAEGHARLAAAVGWQWCRHGRAREARAELERAHADGHQRDIQTRINVANVLCSVMIVQGDSAQVGDIAHEALLLSRSLAGVVEQAAALLTLGVVCLGENNFDRATAYLSEALALSASVDDQRIAAFLTCSAHANLGVAARGRGDPAAAILHHETALAGYRTLGSRVDEMIAQADIGDVARDQGLFSQALAHYQPALTSAWELGEQRSVVELLNCIASAAVGLHVSEQAVQLFGASARLRDRYGFALRLPIDQASDERCFIELRATLTEETFAAQWAAGQALGPEQILALAQSVCQAPEESAPQTPAIVLTTREQQVLPFLVAGQTDREIAAALFIGRRTVEGHVANILAKLNAPTRTAAARTAIAEGLIPQTEAPPD